MRTTYFIHLALTIAMCLQVSCGKDNARTEQSNTRTGEGEELAAVTVGFDLSSPGAPALAGISPTRFSVMVTSPRGSIYAAQCFPNQATVVTYDPGSTYTILVRAGMADCQVALISFEFQDHLFEYLTTMVAIPPGGIAYGERTTGRKGAYLVAVSNIDQVSSGPADVKFRADLLDLENSVTGTRIDPAVATAMTATLAPQVDSPTVTLRGDGKIDIVTRCAIKQTEAGFCPTSVPGLKQDHEHLRMGVYTCPTNMAIGSVIAFVQLSRGFSDVPVTIEQDIGTPLVDKVTPADLLVVRGRTNPDTTFPVNGCILIWRNNIDAEGGLSYKVIPFVIN